MGTKVVNRASGATITDRRRFFLHFVEALKVNELCHWKTEQMGWLQEAGSSTTLLSRLRRFQVERE